MNVYRRSIFKLFNNGWYNPPPEIVSPGRRRPTGWRFFYPAISIPFISYDKHHPPSTKSKIETGRPRLGIIFMVQHHEDDIKSSQHLAKTPHAPPVIPEQSRKESCGEAEVGIHEKECRKHFPLLFQIRKNKQILNRIRDLKLHPQYTKIKTPTRLNWVAFEYVC